MNRWTELSIELANQFDYLDQLFTVYPTIPDGIRDISANKWDAVKNAYDNKNNRHLIDSLLDLNLFPIKDSYVAYLKRDKLSIDRNPETVNRLCGRLFQMGIEVMYEKCTEPKETNRQIGPLFNRWLNDKNPIGVPIYHINHDETKKFLSEKGNCLLNGSDEQLGNFAGEHLNYDRDKGLDFVAKFNGQYVIGEAKFLTDFGGHQNAQFEDAISTLESSANSKKIAILDGVLFIPNRGKMHKYLKNNPEKLIISALVLREFLFQI